MTPFAYLYFENPNSARRICRSGMLNHLMNILLNPLKTFHLAKTLYKKRACRKSINSTKLHQGKTLKIIVELLHLSSSPLKFTFILTF